MPEVIDRGSARASMQVDRAEDTRGATDSNDFSLFTWLFRKAFRKERIHLLCTCRPQTPKVNAEKISFFMCFGSPLLVDNVLLR